MTSAVNSGVLVYYFVAHMYGFCLLLSMFSTWLLLKKKMIVVPAILLALSLGIYQAYFASVILIIFLYQMCRLLKEEVTVPAWLEEVVRCVCTVLAALLLYIALNKFALNMAGLSIAGYVKMSENVVPSYGLSDILQLIRSSYTLMFAFLFRHQYFFADNVLARICIALSGVLFLYLYGLAFRKTTVSAKRVLLLLLLILLPLMINLPMFVEKAVPERICLNWYFIYILPLLLLDAVEGSALREAANPVSVHRSMLLPLILITMTTASLYSAYRNVTIYTGYQKANEIAEETVHDIESRLAACEGYRQTNELCFIGTLDVNKINTHFFDIEYSEYLHKLFNRDHSSTFKRFALRQYTYLTPDDARVMKYTLSDMKEGKMKTGEEMLYCISGIHVGFPTIHSNDPRIRSMPSYPNQGCVQVLDGITFIKLSD